MREIENGMIATTAEARPSHSRSRVSSIFPWWRVRCPDGVGVERGFPEFATTGSTGNQGNPIMFSWAGKEVDREARV
jgi:hypothetical protein